ncbi:MAG TPA: hypothetical protein VEH57_06500 [Thermoplasmata archaeon]|nr:hypothetical protein [Thermoplasmata archaeon]
MFPGSSREAAERRARVACKVCGDMIDLPHMRDHLRTVHQVDSATLESMYLSARIEARRSRRPPAR